MMQPNSPGLLREGLWGWMAERRDWSGMGQMSAGPFVKIECGGSAELRGWRGACADGRGWSGRGALNGGRFVRATADGLLRAVVWSEDG